MELIFFDNSRNEKVNEIITIWKDKYPNSNRIETVLAKLNDKEFENFYNALKFKL